ncbi:MAG: hypothetical protein Q9171_003063 [Xanthocarpia ochracea]
MAPTAPTGAEKEAKKNAKAEKNRQNEIERKESQSKESGSPVVMNPDGSYSSLGALAPETPYATQGKNMTRSSSTGSSNGLVPSTSTFNFGSNAGLSPSLPQPFRPYSFSQVPPAMGISHPVLNPAAEAGPSPATNGFKVPTKTSFDFAVGPSTTSLSLQPPSTSDFRPPSKPTFNIAFGTGLFSSSPQPPEANIFNPVPTSTSVFDPLITPEARRLSNLLPNQPVNAATSIEGPSMTDILKLTNSMGSDAASIEQGNLFFKPFDLGMQMRQCCNNPDGLNKCITLMENEESAKEAKIRSLETQLLEARQKVKDAADLHADNADLKEANSKIEAKERRITELEHENEAVRARAQSAHDQQAEQLITKDEEIAKLKARDSDIRNVTEKAEEDIEAKERRINELRSNCQDANNRYKALVALHDEEKVKLKLEFEEKEAAIEEFRRIAHEKSEQFDGLRQQAKEANLKSKKSEDHARSSEDRVEQQNNTIDENKIAIVGLQKTIQHLKKELQENKEEIRSMRLEKGSESKSHSDCNAHIHRLKSEKSKKEQEIVRLNRFYTLKHAEELRHAEREFAPVQDAYIGLERDLDGVRLRIRGDEHTIEEYRRENQRLRDEIEKYKKKIWGEPEATNKEGSEVHAENPEILYSPTPVNELSQFSPALNVLDTAAMSSPGTPDISSGTPASRLWPPGTWQPQTESTMGDSGDSEDEGPWDHDITLRAKSHDLGIKNALGDMCEQGTQTDTPNFSTSQQGLIFHFKPNSPGLGISKPMIIVDNAPSSPPKLSISKVMTIVDNTPSSPSELDTSKLGDIVGFRPDNAGFSISKPIIGVDDSPSSPPKLSISKLMTIIDHTPSSPSKLGISKLRNIIDIKPDNPGLSISKSMPLVDNTQSAPPKLDISKIVTIINCEPEVRGISTGEPVTTVDNTPGSAVVTCRPDKHPINKNPSRWEWLWYLFMLLAITVLTFTAFYGESARRERNMWLQANDFTRRAVFSVRAGGGAGTSFPAWLWNDQLLDVTKHYYK